MVISKHNGGRFGNQLFGFAFGWLLARALGCALQSYQLDCFPNTREPLLGAALDGPDEHVTDTTESFEEIVRRCTGKRAIVRGHFERTEFYLPERNLLRKLFYLPQKSPPQEGVVFHFRGTDFRGVRKEAPLSYYVRAWDILGRPEKVSAVTDDLDYPIVKEFSGLTGASVRHGDILEDFAFMMAAQQLVISRSTFAWWAAFLSDARVVFPVMASRTDSNKFRNLGNSDWIQISY